ncbi:hypothetical protein CEXT_232541 [Caerostris extrusa]|uniref:Uncharacterized protein n=1 Tax=Caerostris extrusa TaxID=172846 RepID=A0AAV4X8I8_CAEEX|nr:hypothetical protein CEXT_232541 [Caerostris extrusa]
MADKRGVRIIRFDDSGNGLIDRRVARCMFNKCTHRFCNGGPVNTCTMHPGVKETTHKKPPPQLFATPQHLLLRNPAVRCPTRSRTLQQNPLR